MAKLNRGDPAEAVMKSTLFLMTKNWWTWKIVVTLLLKIVYLRANKWKKNYLYHEFQWPMDTHLILLYYWKHDSDTGVTGDDFAPLIMSSIRNFHHLSVEVEKCVLTECLFFFFPSNQFGSFKCLGFTPTSLHPPHPPFRLCQNVRTKSIKPGKMLTCDCF